MALTGCMLCMGSLGSASTVRTCSNTHVGVKCPAGVSSEHCRRGSQETSPTGGSLKHRGFLGRYVAVCTGGRWPFDLLSVCEQERNSLVALRTLVAVESPTDPRTER